jgi:hypothetical protein
MSTHDRGAFGALLAEAKALGIERLSWDADLSEPDDSEDRWVAWVATHGVQEGRGRTGEEALRRLVEKLRPVV